MEAHQQDQILFLLKALADESRLALLQYLNEGERTVGDLAAQVNLGEPTVSHHLARLREAGFVTLRMAGNQRFYRLNESGLATFKRLAATIEHIPPVSVPAASDDRWIEALGWDVADQKVLREFTTNGKLTHLPNREKKLNKLIVVLRWIATLFEPGRMYSEPEVNEILKTLYEEDFVSLRRELIDFGYLRRERGGGKYWLAPAGEEIAETL